MQTLRFADQKTAQDYPLEVPGAIEWSRAPRGWEATVPLPDLPDRTIVTPSLSLLDQPCYRFQFALNAGNRDYPLPPVPFVAGTTAMKNPSDGRLKTAIDCFHTSRRFTDARLTATCLTDARPDRYLLAVSIRPNELEVSAPSGLRDVHTTPPPTHSQMLENPRIAGGICSPVSTAMVIRLHRPGVDYGAVISACFDPATRMYGMWPLAIRAASQFGVIGAVELFADWTPVMACLERGIPVVASIRYGVDQLPGTPQRSTGGHLVVVHGISNGEVLVNDPAAPNHGSVARRYPATDFGRAWFRYRGAAYILIP